MAANRKRQAGGARKKTGRSGTGLHLFGYLGVAALGAVVALAATGELSLPDWKAGLAQVQQIARGEADRPAPRPAAKPSGPTTRQPASRPDRSIQTAALPVPQRPVPDTRRAVAPLPAGLRPPADVAPTPKADVPRGAVAPAGIAAVKLSRLAFPVCGDAPSRGCVVDGDTFVLDGKAIRVADIDTPESGDPKCQREALLAQKAKLRLRDLLSAGPVELVAASRDTDVYGRKLRTVMRDGRSLGDTLIAEGLARRWTGKKTSWCG